MESIRLKAAHALEEAKSSHGQAPTERDQSRLKRTYQEIVNAHRLPSESRFYSLKVDELDWSTWESVATIFQELHDELVDVDNRSVGYRQRNSLRGV